MSAKLVRAEIERFLKTDDPEVLCITGKWGVGKTYSWEEHLKEFQEAGAVSLTRYAYVSLFGQNSLGDLKYSIFENSTPIDALEKGADFSTFAKSYSTARKFIRSNLQYASIIPQAKSLLEGAGGALFLAVRNQIVCIDDLERAGNGLAIKDVLGMISFLKERRQCKVVLLLNDEALPQDEQAEFKSQLEKVVDTRLTFKPTPAEATKIVVTPNSGFENLLADNCISLGITNLRVIKKIEALCRRLQENLKEYNPDVLKKAIHIVTLFGWMHYQPDDAPTFEFVKRYNSFGGLLAADDAPDENRENWSALLRAYGFSIFDEFDEAILTGVLSGYFETDTLKSLAAEFDKKLELQRKNNSFNEAWDNYHSSFNSNADEVLDKIAEAFQRCIETISPTKLSETITLFKDLGRRDQALDLLAIYMKERSGDRNFFGLAGSVLGAQVEDPDVREAFAKRLTMFGDQRDPAQVLENISINSAWGPEDIDLLSALSVDDFVAMLKVQTGRSLHRIITCSLQFGRYQGESDALKKIANIATEALQKIAAESPINARRVSWFGIVPKKGVE